MPEKKKKIKLKGLITSYFRFRGIDLLQAREEAGLTEWQLADCIPFWTQQNISLIESSAPDKIHIITVEQYRQINKALNI